MPTINIHGSGGGPKGNGPGGTRRHAGGKSLDEVFLELLRNPTPSKENEFAMLWSRALPSSRMLGGGWTGMGGRDVMSQIQGVVQGIRRRGAGSAALGGAAGVERSARIYGRYGNTPPEMMAALSVMRNLATGNRGQPVAAASLPAIMRREEKALIAIEASTKGTFNLMRYTLRPSSWRMGGGGGGNMTIIPPGAAGGGGGRGGGGGIGDWSPWPSSSGGGAARARSRGGGSGELLRGGVKMFTAYEALKFMANPMGLVSRLDNAALGASAPYMDLRERAFAFGRAGKFSGGAMQKEFFPGGNVTPDWMKALNVGPSGALDMLSNYGIAPRSPGHASSIAKSLGYYENVAPGFSGMTPGSATGAARQAAGLGMVSPGGTPTGYLSSVSGIMEGAIQRGMDRARVLDSIQSILASMEKGGAIGINGDDTMKMFWRIAQGGTPGGRTGALQADTVGGINSALSSVGSSPVTTMAMYSQMQKTPPTGHSGLAKLMGMTQQQYDEQMKNNPTFAFTANGVIGEYNAGRTGMAALGLSEMMKMSPGAAAGMFTGYMKDMKGISPLQQALGLRSFGIPYAAGAGMIGGFGSDKLPGASGTPGSYLSDYTKGNYSNLHGYDVGGQSEKMGVPLDVYGQRQSAEVAGLQSAQQIFTVFGQSVVTTNDSLAKLPPLLDKFGTAIAGALSKLDPGGLYNNAISNGTPIMP